MNLENGHAKPDPVKKFLIACQGHCPIIPSNGIATMNLKVQCPKPGCGNVMRLQHQQSMGGSLLADLTSIREVFERVGTNISIQTKDVLAGARIKEIGDAVIEWCRTAGIGQFADIAGVNATITRLEDDTELGSRIEAKPMPKLVLAGGSC